MLNVGAAANFLAEPVSLGVAADCVNLYVFTVFICKESAGSFFLCLFERKNFHRDRKVFLDLLVHDVLNLLDFLGSHRPLKGKVKAHALVVYVAAFLGNLVAEHVHKRLLQKVGGRVVLCRDFRLFGQASLGFSGVKAL